MQSLTMEAEAKMIVRKAKTSRILSFILGVSLLGILYPSAAFSQSWTNILSTSRAINWGSAGLPASFTDKGGSNVETTTNPWAPPTRTQYGSTINPSGNATTDLSNLNTAFTNCTDGHYILLGSGTFLIQGILFMEQNSCTIRGAGAQSTTLAVSGSGVIFMGAGAGDSTCMLTSGSNYSAGSTTITCNNLNAGGTAPAVGDVAFLNQYNTGFTGSVVSGNLVCSTGSSSDNGGIFVCGWLSDCSEASTGYSNNGEGQTVLITSVSNASGTYTVGISPGIYMPNWAYPQTPSLGWNPAQYNAVGVALEDLTVYSSSVSGNVAVQLSNAYASWLKGVRFVGSGTNNPLSTFTTVNCLISNNYFFPNIPLTALYNTGISTTASDDMLELNNIYVGGILTEGDGQNVGWVLAYNYNRDMGSGYVENIHFDHHPYGSFQLAEGDEFAGNTIDWTFGSHGFDTTFRSYAECWDAPYSTYSGGSNARGMVINPYQRFENFVGNTIGNGGYCTSYQGSAVGAEWQILSTPDNTLVTTTMMRWGNVGVVTQSSDTPANSGVRFVSSEVPSSLSSPNVPYENPVPGTDSLPCSFFLAGYTATTCSAHPSGGTGLSWWKVCKTWTTFPTSCASTQLQPFPPVGPDVTSGPYVNGYAYDIPAQIAELYLPVDTTYQSSYTIASSSWATGTETLTFGGSVLPNIEHLMGKFQLSGAGINAACLTGATVNAANEILMTGSTSTTVQYALASNPGSNACGNGSTTQMLFPDVKEFDERVYENDPSGGGSYSGSQVTSGVGLSKGVSVQ